VTALLFDPAAAPPGAWPEGDSDARRYIGAIATAGAAALVANVRTKWLALRIGDRVLPVTVNDGEYDDSYVCLPHSAYALYARQELDIVDVGRMRPLYRLLLGFADHLLRRADINRIIHVDNWLLSTNLHGDWDGTELPEIRRLLTARYPHHILAIRSLDPWSCPQLLDAATRDGWTLLPSRQIWVTEDVARDWRPRQSTANDRRRLKRSGLTIDAMDTLHDGDAERIAELYHMLYVGKYSPLNPVFTPDWVRMTHMHRLLHYRGVRDADGRLMAVAGLLERGGVCTPPVVGYDTTRPQVEGLYRIAAYLFSEIAEHRRWRLNGSAGAAHFKRQRGATGVIEYSAMSIAHLPPVRRALVGLLSLILTRIAVPMMRKRKL
jgi:hypothetical protein